MEHQVRMTPHGKSVQTIININSTKQFCFTTMKRYSGNVSTTVRMETFDNNFITYTYGDYAKDLVSSKIRATEKALMTQHTKAVEEFVNSEEYAEIMKEKGN